MMMMTAIPNSALFHSERILESSNSEQSFSFQALHWWKQQREFNSVPRVLGKHVILLQNRKKLKLNFQQKKGQIDRSDISIEESASLYIFISICFFCVKATLLVPLSLTSMYCVSVAIFKRNSTTCIKKYYESVQSILETTFLCASSTI